MKILVVGGAGYVGSVLIPKLLSRGYEVDVVDLFWFGNYLPKKVGVVEKDVFHLKEEDLKYDQVIFLAGLSNDPMAECAPAMNFIFNNAAPTYLAYMAKKVGVKRFIYASSCSIYGYRVSGLCGEEDGTMKTCSFPYGISKFQGEQGCLQMVSDKFSVICLRKGTISGYSPRMRLDLIVNTMFKNGLKGRVITVTNPSLWRPILAIQDAATAYVRAIEVDENVSGVFNISSGNYTVGEVADLVNQGIGGRAKVDIKHIPDLRSYKVKTDKARDVLGFKPSYDVKDIVQDLVDHAHKFSDFDNPKYSNIEVFKGVKKWEIVNT